MRLRKANLENHGRFFRRFESVSEPEEYKNNKTGTTIELGFYNGKPLSWTKIGEFDGKSLYLCNSALGKRRFDKSSGNYLNSEIREWLLSCCNDIFTGEELQLLSKHPFLGDKLFLLSSDNVYEHWSGIENTGDFPYYTWWLRTPGYSGYGTSCVYDVEVVNDYGVEVTDLIAVRPAIILKRD